MRVPRSVIGLLFLVGACVNDDPIGPPSPDFDSGASMATLSADGLVELQPLPGDQNIRVKAVNASGQVVGTSDSRDVIWGQDGVPRELVGLRDVMAINDLGHVAGATLVGGRKQAAIWRNGVVTDI